MRMNNRENPWGAFCDVFGATARNRVLEVFLEGSGVDNGLSNIAEETELSRATVYNVVDELLERGIITPSRKVAGAQLYKMNEDNGEVKILLKAFKETLRMVAEEMERKYAKKIAVI